MLISKRSECKKQFFPSGPRKGKIGADGRQGAGMTKTGKILGWLLLAALLPLLCGCSAKKASTEFFAMDTVMQLTAYGTYADAAVDAAEVEIARLDAKLSAQNETSEIAKLNAGGFCEDSETLCVLARAAQIAELTEGAYDPTVYPLMQLWGFGTEHAHVPQQAEIETALEAVGYERLPAVKAPYRLPEGMAIDLGGIGKGFAAQTVRRCLQKQGVKSAVLSLGGNVTLLGSKPDGTDWTVGLQDPQTDGCFGYLSASDVSVVTSGGYQRYFEENGRRYWHILDAGTGMPADTAMTSVTVVSADDTLADGLSTALFVMGLDRAAQFWRESREFEAVFLLDSGEIYVTQGLADSFRSERSFEVLTR